MLLRDARSADYSLAKKLQLEDNSLRNFLVMDKKSFVELLEKICPNIQRKRKRTNIREPLSHEEHLSLTHFE